MHKCTNRISGGPLDWTENFFPQICHCFALVDGLAGELSTEKHSLYSTFPTLNMSSRHCYWVSTHRSQEPSEKLLKNREESYLNLQLKVLSLVKSYPSASTATNYMFQCMGWNDQLYMWKKTANMVVYFLSMYEFQKQKLNSESIRIYRRSSNRLKFIYHTWKKGDHFLHYKVRLFYLKIQLTHWQFYTYIECISVTAIPLPSCISPPIPFSFTMSSLYCEVFWVWFWFMMHWI